MTDAQRPNSFLNLPEMYYRPETARYIVLPVPYEGTVSYATGTADGPDAILTASAQVELFDETLQREFYQAGVATLPPVAAADTPEEQIRRVEQAVLPIFRAGKFPLTLGGEHSITAGLVQAAAAVHGDISVLQVDAHADLRDSYRGSVHSHGAVMRRVLEVTGRVAQVGIRSYSLSEFEQCPAQVANFITPRIVRTDPAWIGRTLDLLGEKVYLTIDIDGLDPAEAPGTGTPEPGGLQWQEVIDLLWELCQKRQVIGADIVEVRPLPPSNVTEFMAARLAYKIIAFTQRP